MPRARWWGLGEARPRQFDYARWIVRRVGERRPEFQAAAQPGLFSLLTVAANPNPEWFDELAWSVLAQDFPHFEWIIVDVGSHRPIRRKLEELAKDPRVATLQAPGRSYVAGLRCALEAATQRLVLPLDAEDRLYPDALRVAAAFLQQHNFPAFVYSDEDQLPPDGKPTHPFCKPDWDPLLFFSGSYTARLAILDRQLLLRANAFAEEAADRCAVWDACGRLAGLGLEPAHLPEILYSRRVAAPRPALQAEPGQTGAAYFVSRAHLRRLRLAEKLNLRGNPLLGDAGLWRLAWQPSPRDPAIPTLPLEGTLGELEQRLHRLTGDTLAAFAAPETRLLTADWADEARALFAAQPDVVAVSGSVLDEAGTVRSGGEFFGMDGFLASPSAGRERTDPAGQGRLLCQQTVGAPSPAFFVAEVGFLKDLLAARGQELAMPLLHAWVGAEARAQGYRVAFSPHLVARQAAAATLPSAEETWRFLKAHWPLLLDDPAWSRFLSLDAADPFRIAEPAERAAALNRTLSHLAGALPFETQLRVSETHYPSRMSQPLQRSRLRRAA